MFFMYSFYLFFFNIFYWILALILIIFNKKFILEWNIYIFNSFKINYIIFIDWMMLIFISTVMLITSLVILYSIDYMSNDIFIKRFMLLIIIFVFSMILMISSPNMISILLGWDGLGLSSYCLVAYYQNKKSFNSSMITILMNRIGDIMILLSISMMIKNGSWNFIFLKKMNFLLLILLMIASITKSAQIPFSSWLPLAMAAPTPISSLVHSSTLVTAGVYLLIRFNYIMNKNFLLFLMILSCLTMFMAGSSAIFEFDFKKIIALSTLSQLGLMIFSISFNQPTLAFFHLITHAMFKSLLFLCSGIIIHNYFNYQDIRFISLMNLNLPFINLTLNIASLTLCGIPFLSGFYSKDLIIEMFLMNNSFNNWLMMIMMYLSMMMTILYSFRLIFYISMKNIKITIMNFYKSWNIMNYSILILLLMSLFYGSMLNWIIMSSLNLIFLPKNLKLIIYMFLMLGMFFSMTPKFNIKIYQNKIITKMFIFLNLMWFLPLLMKKNKMNIFKINNKIILFSDLSWIEMISSKKKIFFLNYIKEYKIIKKLNYMVMFLMTSYLMMILIMM